MDSNLSKDIASAPLPTRSTLRSRQNLPYQVIRFLAFNIRMLKMVLKGHE